MRLLFSVVLPLSIYFASGVICSVAACDAPNMAGRQICTIAAFFCFYCFFSRLIHYHDKGE